jgi:3-phosphoshikimate 1-carboxyvinyltransferase
MAVVHDLVVVPQARPLSGSVPLPSDPRIAELALLCAALAEGESEIRWIAPGRDIETMVGALRSLGVAIDMEARGARVRGVGLSGLSAPRGAIDCGSSASVMAALAGVLVARPFETVLSGDETFGAIDLADLAGALRRRGGQIEGRFSATQAGQITLPLVVGPLPPRLQLSEVEHDVSTGPDIKAALLLSGLYAVGPTYVRERVVSCDHVVRLLGALDVPISTAGSVVELDPGEWSAELPPFSCDVAGDFSAAMLFLAAASLVEGSRVCTRGAGQNPTRTGAVDFLRSMGGAIEVEVHAVILGEPEGMACVSFAPLRAVSMAGEALARADRDLAVLVALASRARGRTDIQGGIDLQVADRAVLAKLGDVVRRFGVLVESGVDGITIEGCPDRPLRATEVDARGDANMAVAAALLGLVGDGPTRVRGVDGLAGRFPRFVGTLRALGAEVHLEQRTS